MIQVSIPDITRLASEILVKNGVSNEDAEIIIMHLLDGELSGKPSHGFYRIPGIVNAVRNSLVPTSITSEKETDNSVLLNGGGRQGLVVAQKATETAVTKSKERGIVAVGAYNFVGTTGGMGYFARQIADADLVGIIMPNSGSAIAPWGGKDPIFGTNPIAIGIPSTNDPVIIDLATSQWAYGDIDLALKDGKDLPLGVVLDSDGNPSTDPRDALNGSMLPFAGHKGAALALAVEILAGPLVNAKAGAQAVPGSDGIIIMAIDPSVFVPLDQFKSQVDALIQEIKKSGRRSGVDELFYPGERSERKRSINREREYINMIDRIYNDLLAISNEDSSASQDYIA